MFVCGAIAATPPACATKRPANAARAPFGDVDDDRHRSREDTAHDPAHRAVQATGRVEPHDHHLDAALARVVERRAHPPLGCGVDRASQRDRRDDAAPLGDPRPCEQQAGSEGAGRADQRAAHRGAAATARAPIPSQRGPSRSPENRRGTGRGARRRAWRPWRGPALRCRIVVLHGQDRLGTRASVGHGLHQACRLGSVPIPAGRPRRRPVRTCLSANEPSSPWPPGARDATLGACRAYRERCGGTEFPPPCSSPGLRC
jgi:hypothetical protein